MCHSTEVGTELLAVEPNQRSLRPAVFDVELFATVTLVLEPHYCVNGADGLTWEVYNINIPSNGIIKNIVVRARMESLLYPGRTETRASALYGAAESQALRWPCDDKARARCES